MYFIPLGRGLDCVVCKACNFIDWYLCDGAEPVLASPSSATATASAAPTLTAMSEQATPAAAELFFFFFKEAAAACAANRTGRWCANVSDKLNGTATNTG